MALSSGSMLDGRSSWQLHFAQNAALILISLFFLPLDTFIILLLYGARPLLHHDAGRQRARRSPAFRPKIVLVTGVGMSKGLTLARMFYEAGHTVIGADFEPYAIPVCGRFSRALKRFYKLPVVQGSGGSAHYAQKLLDVVRREKVDIWVSCSGVASAVEDGLAKEVIERQSDCRCIQFDMQTTSILHEKDAFIEQTKQLQLPTPETHNVTSRTAVHKVLNHTEKKKKYILKSVGVDDANRGNMTILPRRTMSETYHHVANVPISPQKPWVLQQYVQGKEYCTHALIVNGHVKAFVACPSLDVLMHYEALSADSALSRAMLKFTEAFVGRSGGCMTGHLSFDFLVDEIATERGAEMVLQPIECNPRAHTAVVLFEGKSEEMAQVYMGALKPQVNGVTEEHESDIVIPAGTPKYYWIGHDIVALVLYPLFLVFMRRMTVAAYLHSCVTFFEHLLFWRDGTFETWDPLPWWSLYHIYWPAHFVRCILQRQKWSRMNVSTTKMFVC